MQKASSAACDRSAESCPFSRLSLFNAKALISCLHSFSGKLQSFKDPSSIQKALISCLDSISGKLHLSRLSLFNTKSRHQLPSIRSAESLLFQGSLSSIQKALHQLPSIRSAASFLFSRLSPFSTKSSSSAAIDSFSRKVSFFIQGSLSQYKALHQLPLIRSAESFLFFKAPSLQYKKLSISCLRFVQQKASFIKALSLQYKKPFISCL